MNTEIALVTAVTVLANVGLVGGIAWAFYRVLRNRPIAVRVDSQSYYAHERAHGIQRQR